MGMIKLLFAPIRAIARFPLFQFAVVVAVILFLQAADEKSALGQIFDGLDKLVDSTVTFLSAIITVKSFTKSCHNRVAVSDLGDSGNFGGVRRPNAKNCDESYKRSYLSHQNPGNTRPMDGLLRFRVF